MAERSRTKAQQFWMSQIERAKKRESNWRKRGDKIVERYRDEKDRASSTKRLNILWANTEILKPATFSQLPTPDVRRTHTQDQDILARISAEVMERVLTWFAEKEEFSDAIRGARDDMLLPGRGTVRVRYDAKFAKRELFRSIEGDEEDQRETFFLGSQPMEPDFTDDDGNGFIEEKTDERVALEYVFWKDIYFSDNKRWDKIWWVAFRHELPKGQIEDQFGKKALSKLEKSNDDKDNEEFEIWEVWNKRKRQRLWLGTTGTDIIEREDDPLGLTDFFPIPKPLFAIKTTDSFIPVPEFTIYQDQADELDDIEDRLHKLVASAKAAGIYDAVQEETVRNLVEADDGELRGIRTAEALRQGGGLSNAIFFMPIQHIAQTIAQLTNRKEQLKQEIFEITGISDILRGQTDPRETASAQQIKQSVGSIRLRPRREPMEAFIREIYRMMSEIVADKFDIETFGRITGFRVPPEAIQFIRDPDLRNFRIDVETESTVQPDADQEKQRAMEFIQSVTTFLGQAGTIIEAAPQATPLMMEMIRFGARQFKVGRRIEQEIDAFTRAMISQPPIRQQQQGESEQVEMAQTQARIQADLQKAALEAATADKDRQGDILKNLLDVAAAQQQR